MLPLVNNVQPQVLHHGIPRAWSRGYQPGLMMLESSGMKRERNLTKKVAVVVRRAPKYFGDTTQRYFAMVERSLSGVIYYGTDLSCDVKGAV